MLDDRERKLIDKLPAPARQRLAKLVAERDALAAAARDRSDSRTYLRSEIETEQVSLERLLAAPHDDGMVIAARESLAIKRQEVADLDAADHFSIENRQSINQIVNRAIEFVVSIPGDARLQMLNRPEPTSRKGEGFPDAIERCRSRIAKLLADLAEIETAPLPAALAKANATREIEQLAERGRPNVVGMVEHGGRLQLPEKFSRILGGEGSLEVDDTLAVMAWLLRDAMIAAVHKEIDAAADDEHALAPAERATATAKIAAQIDDAERDEASYIDQAAKAGVSIAHRPDIGIRAVLGLSEELISVPKVEKPYRSQAIGQPMTAAPQHSPSLPQPATRDQIWR